MKALTHDQKNNGSHGYTLIEVLMAVAIFSIGFLAVSSMQISSINANANARSQTTVLTYAKDKVEDIMALSYSDPDLDADPGVNPHTPNAGDDGIDNNENGEIDESGETGHISIQWTVTEVDLNGDTENDAKTVRITAARNAGGKQRQASLDIIKAPF